MQEGDQNVNQNGVIWQMLKDEAKEKGPVTGTSENYKTLKTKEGEPWWFLRVNLEMVAAQDGEDAEKLESVGVDHQVVRCFICWGGEEGKEKLERNQRNSSVFLIKAYFKNWGIIYRQ